MTVRGGDGTGAGRTFWSRRAAACWRRTSAFPRDLIPAAPSSPSSLSSASANAAMGPLRGFAARFFFAAGFRPYLSVVRTDVSPRLNPLMANAEGAPEDDPARPTRREEWRDGPRQGKSVVARRCLANN